jgi:probable HAF family extracellular repeat protein
LGTLGGNSSAAYGINASGQVVGQSDITGNTSLHATRWSGTHAIDLGTLGGRSSTAVSINTAGEVVGSAQTSSNSQHAALWTGGKVVDLNMVVSPTLTPSVTLTAAVAINDNGQIAVYGENSQTGEIKAYVLTP